ncbi:hypothetical protein [Streptomyces sp. NPDC001292]|uniref:hypothetical protein n=1 Tax=Streptomyces sp. NPDC001292 TaxID=3364558 RepID=UPI0036F38684
MLGSRRGAPVGVQQCRVGGLVPDDQQTVALPLGTEGEATVPATGAAPFRRPSAGLALRRPKAEAVAPSTMATGTMSAVR